MLSTAVASPSAFNLVQWQIVEKSKGHARRRQKVIGIKGKKKYT